MAARAFVIRMYLDRKLRAGEKKLDEQRKAAAVGSGFAHEVTSKPAGQRGQILAGKRAVHHPALIAGKPDLAHRCLLRAAPVLIKRRQVTRSPDALYELRGQQEWIQLRHGNSKDIVFQSTQYPVLRGRNSSNSA